MLFVFVLAALATKFTPAQASSEVVSQLYDSTAITQPMAPSKLNSALTGLVRTVANFTTFPSNLQRAMLWGAGLVRVSGSDQYVQVYVQCGRTMSSIFPTAQTFDDSALCEIKNCKSNVITFTESTCDPSYVETKTLCALSPESEPSSVTFKQTGGPMWAMDGQIDDTIDPQLFQFNGTSSSDNTTIYMLAQKGSWPMSDDTCPNGAAFIVPCRKISSAEVNYGMQGSVWCEPEVEQSVQMWLSSGSLASATDNATVDGLSSPTIVGIIAACIAVGIVVLGLVVAQRRRSGANQGQTGLWNDDIITANRVPREKVRALTLISRGAFGEVYAGIYNDEQVAVKMLLPSTRRDIKQVNEFLMEARLTAMMEHPRIVGFIGVAWDSLSDLCVVLEFMGGGDLRTLLSNYEKSGHCVGFDREKVTIALHVAHALTYLHSLEPSVIHRDLKSRNILLNEMHEAKLTDFGISRERLDRTMTAGVGTSLWMAPEVMTGEQYDDKADIFSFGVVLSELDLHTLPYAQAKEELHQSHGRQMTDATLLQRVAMGAVSVRFSNAGPLSMVDLGSACVSVDPSKRPSAAEALFKLQMILSRELI